MARQDALSLYMTNDSTKAELLELYGDVIEIVENNAISIQLKNKGYVQMPNAGSVEVYRLQTAASQTYGTARTAASGDKVKRDPVVVPIDVHKEIVEEWKRNEAAQVGVPNLVAKRSTAHSMSMINELDTAFFAEAVSEGTELSVTGYSTTATKVSALIRAVEATTNDYILNGIDRSYLALSLTPAYWDALEDFIFTLPNPANGGVTVQTYKNVRVFKNLNQTEDAICMALESIAQPVNLTPYDVEETLPLSNDTAVKTFFDYGTKAVTDDLIQYADLAAVASA